MTGRSRKKLTPLGVSSSLVIQAEEEKERLALENKKQQKQIEKLHVKQAVKLLISYMGFFYALIGYWRLPLRKIIVFALVANAPSVNSVKCNRFLFDKVATYNFL